MEKKLDPYEEEARAGVPDLLIAQKSGVPLAVVVRWRKALRIKRPRGITGGAEGQRYALELLGPGFDAEKHAVGNVFDGKWKIPEYVVRVPLNYTELCRVLHRLKDLSDSTLSEALGISEQDINNARAVWDRYLSKKGVICKKCEQLVDPKHRC